MVRPLCSMVSVFPTVQPWQDAGAGRFPRSASMPTLSSSLSSEVLSEDVFLSIIWPLQRGFPAYKANWICKLSCNLVSTALFLGEFPQRFKSMDDPFLWF